MYLGHTDVYPKWIISTLYFLKSVPVLLTILVMNSS